MKLLFPILMALTSTLASTLPKQTRSSKISPPSLVTPGFSQTFLDEFDGKADTLPSASNWIFDTGTSYPGGAENWGNNEYQTYTTSKSNIHITKEENLAIIPQLKDGVWTSARIETQRSDFVAAKGGKLLVEARIKLRTVSTVQQQGIWPAFWALGTDFRGNYTNWPMATEWDFLEVINGGSTIYSTIHCGSAPGGPCNEYNGLGNGGVSFSRGEFHTISFIVDRRSSGSGSGNNSTATWRSESLNWYLDGEKVFTVTGSTVRNEKTWVKLAHEGHFLLLNVAVGGNWPGPPNSSTIDGPSSGMEIDYVGVWNSL